MTWIDRFEFFSSPRLVSSASTLLALASLAGTPALGADASAGKKLFRTQCAICHSAEPNDGGGAQGPDLAGVFDRKAGDHPGFSYTDALRRSNLTWNAATLDRFLTAPAKAVPGTIMAVALANKADRDNVIAYFSALEAGTYQDPAPPPSRPTGVHPAEKMGGPPKSGEDWKLDAPGRAHHVDVAKLPPPFDTRGSRNPPKIVPRPENAKLRVPPGFAVNTFATNLTVPRNLKLAPNGDILLVESSSGRIRVLHPSGDGTHAASITTFAQGLDNPFGIALYPADNPKWLYVAEMNRIVRYAYQPGAVQASGLPEIVVPRLAPDATGGHITRDIAFTANGRQMLVSVGSQSNNANEMSRKPVAQAQAWEKSHALGSTWDLETNRADVLEFDVEQPGAPRYYATGLRNCVGLTSQPATGETWCTVNERDMLGDDLVPDYSTRVKRGQFYGWPWYYLGDNEEPGLKGERPDLKGKVSIPDVLYQAHSAPITMTFYPHFEGRDEPASAFPAEYRGDAFTVMRGSWNRAFRTGHKVVRVRMKSGVPTGEYEDFLIGFITDQGDAWGRIAGSAVAADGSLLITEEVSGSILRISYQQGVGVSGHDIWPESLTSLADGTLIIGSARRTIYRAASGTGHAEPWISLPDDAPSGVFGLLAHEPSNTLYACANTFEGEPRKPFEGTLLTFDLTTGKHQGRYRLPAKNPICNDIAVDGAGNAYVADTESMEIARLKPGAKKLETWVPAGNFGAPDGGVDGIAVLGNRVVVNTVRSNKLFAVEIGPRGKAGKVTELALSRPIKSPDGMRSFGDHTLLLAESAGDTFSMIEVVGGQATVNSLRTELPDGAVAVTAVGSTAYVLGKRAAAEDGKTRTIRALRVPLPVLR